MRSFSAVVLAGGRARRLGGTNKALLEVGGQGILDRVLDALRPVAEQIVVVGHLAGEAELSGVEIVPDLFPEGSTLVGIYSGLLSCRNEVAVAVACDMPFLSGRLLERIARLSEGYDVAVPRVGPHLEALHAAYRRTCLPVMADAIGRGQFKVIDFYPRVRIREVRESEMLDLDPTLDSFLNVNTPADLERARARAPKTST